MGVEGRKNTLRGLLYLLILEHLGRAFWQERRAAFSSSCPCLLDCIWGTWLLVTAPANKSLLQEELQSSSIPQDNSFQTYRNPWTDLMFEQEITTGQKTNLSWFFSCFSKAWWDKNSSMSLANHFWLTAVSVYPLSDLTWWSFNIPFSAFPPSHGYQYFLPEQVIPVSLLLSPQYQNREVSWFNAHLTEKKSFEIISYTFVEKVATQTRWF